MTTPAREGQTYGGESLLVRYVNFVKLPHTLFALPFALLGVLAASLVAPVTPRTVVLVVVAFSAARWVAMGFNRIVDLPYDARNPRTRNRELPRGALSLVQAWGSVAVAGALFLLAAGLLNRLCLWLSPLALAWVMTYSLTKRFTWWPHLWLGLSLAIAPVGGYLAVTGRWSSPAWLLLAITAAVATWVAGFDIFYALPDEGFDRAQGLRSAVVRLGEAPRDPAGQAAARRHHPGARAVRLGRGVRRVVLRRPGRRRDDPGVRAPARPTRRPLAAGRGVLHDERRDVGDGVRVRAGGLPGVSGR